MTTDLYDASLTRDGAEQLGLLSSLAWRTACYVRFVKGIEPFERRKSFVDLVRKKQGDKQADILIDALKKARNK